MFLAYDEMIYELCKERLLAIGYPASIQTLVSVIIIFCDFFFFEILYSFEYFCSIARIFMYL